jgi:HEAT repeat protein
MAEKKRFNLYEMFKRRNVHAIESWLEDEVSTKGWKDTCGKISRLERTELGVGRITNILFEILGMKELQGIDCSPTKLLSAIQDVKSMSILRAKAYDSVVEHLQTQIARGDTLFLDVEELSARPASVLISSILETRSKELEGIRFYRRKGKRRLDARELWSTYYGYTLLSTREVDVFPTKKVLEPIIEELSKIGIGIDVSRQISVIEGDIAANDGMPLFHNPGCSEERNRIINDLLTLHGIPEKKPTGIDPDPKDLAIKDLAVTGDLRFVPQIFKAGHHARYETRSAAARSLAEIGGPEVRERAVELALDGDEFGRMVIANMEDRTELEEILLSGPSATYYEMTRLLEIQGERGKKLLNSYLKKADKNRRVDILTALSAIGGQDVLEQIMKEIEKPGGHRSNQRRRLTKALVNMGTGIVQDLIDTTSTTTSTPLKRYCIEALGMIGDSRAVPLLKQNLGGGGQGSRYLDRGILKALRWIGSPAAVEVLQSSLEKEHLNHFAAAELERLDRGLAVESFRTSLFHGNKVARAIAVDSLGRLRKRGKEVGLEAIKDPNPVIRAAGLKILSRTGLKGNREMVQNLLADSDCHVREEAIKCLCANTGAKPYPLLARLWTDDTDSVVEALIDSLRENRTLESGFMLMDGLSKTHEERIVESLITKRFWMATQQIIASSAQNKKIEKIIKNGTFSNILSVAAATVMLNSRDDSHRKAAARIIDANGEMGVRYLSSQLERLNDDGLATALRLIGKSGIAELQKQIEKMRNHSNIKIKELSEGILRVFNMSGNTREDRLDTMTRHHDSLKDVWYEGHAKQDEWGDYEEQPSTDDWLVEGYRQTHTLDQQKCIVDHFIAQGSMAVLIDLYDPNSKANAYNSYSTIVQCQFEKKNPVELVVGLAKMSGALADLCRGIMATMDHDYRQELESMMRGTAEERYAAGLILASKGSEDAVPILCEASNNNSLSQQIEVIMHLGLINHKDAAKELLKHQRGKSVMRARAATWALSLGIVPGSGSYLEQSTSTKDRWIQCFSEFGKAEL